MDAKNSKYCIGYEILVVDDEAAVAELISEMVKTKGCSATLFNNSTEALEYFMKYKDIIDLVITDQTMPDMTGAELAQSILSEKADMPVFLMTGYSEEIDQEKATKIGIKEFITKPLKLSGLSEKLQKHLPNRSPTESV